MEAEYIKGSDKYQAKLYVIEFNIHDILYMKIKKTQLNIESYFDCKDINVIELLDEYAKQEARKSSIVPVERCTLKREVNESGVKYTFAWVDL